MSVHPPYRALRRGSRGSVLIISLIMLIVMTLMAMAAIKMSTIVLRAVNNSQTRNEAMAAAMSTLDQILSSDFSSNLAGTANTYTVAINANKSYDVVVPEPCIQKVVPIKNTDLDLSKAEDKKCYETLTNPYSACAQTIWEVKASVNDGWFGANVSVTQGTGVRMDNSTATVYANDASHRCS
jgi:Tfp pilus assembly protein PilX